tara:strand:+ start:7337 stop:8815 length:1479 start_codon:yes stop_codon:yes gene_type:complete
MNKKNLVIGLAHGVFDIVHIGHIEHFKEAKQSCDKLIVSVTADKFVNKGPNRPAFTLSDRIKFLKSITYIDEVIVSNYETAIKSIQNVKPDIYFKGLDYDNINKRSKNNLNKEIQEIKKFGGKFLITRSKLKSSSKILNENFNYVNKNVRSFLKRINKKEFLEKLIKTLFNNDKKQYKMLLVGEQILDFYTKVTLQGKSQKSGVITAMKTKTQKYGGGSILVANLLCHFLNKLNFLVDGNTDTVKMLRKYFVKPRNINFITSGKKVNKILIKERYIDAYSKARLFQVNQNQKFFDTNNENKKFQNILLKKTKKFKNIIIFDFGYGYIDENFSNILKNKSNNFYINCQTNSSNYGFNLFSKYKKAEILCVDEAEFRLTFRNRTSSIPEIISKNQIILNQYKTFIVTSGASGCYVLHKKKIEFIPTVFETTLDTTGCGDTFFSTFIYFYLQKKFTLKEISLLAHIAAGLHGLSEGNKIVLNKNNFFQNVQSIIK